MTCQLIRMQAKEIAGLFYEQGARTEIFRLQWPDQPAYVAASWPHFVAEAKGALAALLNDNSVSDHDKHLIGEALIEDYTASQSPNARTVLQADLQPREREDIKHVENSPHLLRVAS